VNGWVAAGIFAAGAVAMFVALSVIAIVKVMWWDERGRKEHTTADQFRFNRDAHDHQRGVS
jgi:hypothetical protein